MTAAIAIQYQRRPVRAFRHSGRATARSVILVGLHGSEALYQSMKDLLAYIELEYRAVQ
jgi:hypothetical protein